MSGIISSRSREVSSSTVVVKNRCGSSLFLFPTAGGLGSCDISSAESPSFGCDRVSSSNGPSNGQWVKSSPS